MLIILQDLPSLMEQLLKSFALLNFEEVLVVTFHRRIVKAEIAWEVLATKELLARTNLGVELVKDFVMREAVWNLIALHWKVMICAICDHLEHARVKFLDNLNCLLSVVNSSHFPIRILLLNLWLVLLVGQMRKLDGICVLMFSWELVPDKRKWIFWKCLDFVNNNREVLLGFGWLLLARVEDGRKLEQFIAWQLLDVDHVDVGPDIL
jgi:hypothetical protein